MTVFVEQEPSVGKREHGHALARGMSAGAVMAEMYGKANGCRRGRGGSMHLFDARRRFFGGHAIVASHLPTAVGLALAAKAAAYGMPGAAVDGMDVLAVEAATRRTRPGWPR
jgi:pyruvate dehydrogenase E1 component alpha subunit